MPPETILKGAFNGTGNAHHFLLDQRFDLAGEFAAQVLLVRLDFEVLVPLPGVIRAGFAGIVVCSTRLGICPRFRSRTGFGALTRRRHTSGREENLVHLDPSLLVAGVASGPNTELFLLVFREAIRRGARLHFARGDGSLVLLQLVAAVERGVAADACVFWELVVSVQMFSSRTKKR